MRRKSFLTMAILAMSAILAAETSTLSAAAAPIAAPDRAAAAVPDPLLQNVRWSCRCDREWAPREYWRWDHRPIWDDPWRVLKPNFWGSPEPHLVPADVWARKWRLRYPWRYRHWHPE